MPLPRHVFIINPIAGTGDYQRRLEAELAADGADSVEVFTTAAAGEAEAFIAGYDPSIAARFYAVGGDGTLNEAVNGVLARGGHSELALLPCGTGDDFARFFPNRADFRDLNKQLSAAARPIDVIATDVGLYGINMVNIGVDADTAAGVHRFSGLFPGTAAYILSLIDRVLLHKLGVAMEITIDDGPPLSGEFLLASFANGSHYGGGFKAAPKAAIDDGLLEICLVKPVSRLKFARLVRGYKNGAHLDDAAYADYITYRRGKKVTLRAATPVNVCIDGEIIKTDTVTVSLLPQKLPFVIPSP